MAQLNPKPVVINLTGAASPARMLPAVFLNGHAYEYTRMKAPDSGVVDLLQRDDGMIGLLELLAVLLVINTWQRKVGFSRWEAYIDSDGPLFAIIGASIKAADANQLFGQIHLRQGSHHLLLKE